VSGARRLAAALWIACLAVGCAPAGAGWQNGGPAGAPRHVVLVVLDNLRADHVGAHGYRRDITPNLDALARQGLRYERAYAASSAASQSLAALWTGRLPSSGGAVGLAEAVPHESLATLPRLFLRAGRRTGLVSNDTTLRDRAFTRGFDDVEIDSVPGRWTGALVTEKALALLDAAGDERLFLTVGYADASEPHLPLQEHRERIDAPHPQQLLSLPNLRGLARELPEGIEASPGFLDLLARYDAEIAYVDDCLGALVDGLAERGLLDETLLVVTSSHGTEFLEHGYVGSAWTLHEEVLAVPLVVRAPGLAPGVVAPPVSLVDLAPTLAALFDLPLGEQAGDGRPLLAREGGRLVALQPPGAVLAELVIPELVILRAAIRHDAKLIEVVKGSPPGHRADLEAGYAQIVTAMLDGTVERPDPFGEPQSVALYDLSIDPSELSDISSEQPDRLAALRAALAAYAERCLREAPDPARAARPVEPPDPDAAETLRQLGYL
jgi:arylsulfatase